LHPLQDRVFAQCHRGGRLVDRHWNRQHGRRSRRANASRPAVSRGPPGSLAGPSRVSRAKINRDKPMTERRPLASRNLRIVQRVAAWLASREVSANAISLASIGFAALGSLCLVGTAGTDGLEARALFVI